MTKNLKSNYCNAEIKTNCGDDFGTPDDIRACWNECTKCEKLCDPAGLPTSVGNNVEPPENSQEKAEKNGRIHNPKTDTWAHSDGSGFRTQEQYIRLDLFRDKWKMKFQEGITKGEILKMSEELNQILSPQPESEETIINISIPEVTRPSTVSVRLGGEEFLSLPIEYQPQIKQLITAMNNLSEIQTNNTPQPESEGVEEWEEKFEKLLSDFGAYREYADGKVVKPFIKDLLQAQAKQIRRAERGKYSSGGARTWDL